MKKKHTLILTAALLTLGVTAAYGQSTRLTAEIPFSFRAVGSDLPAGHYVIAQVSRSGNGTMQLRNLDTGKSVMVQSMAPIKATGSDSKEVRPRLIFQCGGEAGCSLAKLWSGPDGGLEFSTPPLTAAERERRETIYLDRFKEK